MSCFFPLFFYSLGYIISIIVFKFTLSTVIFISSQLLSTFNDFFQWFFFISQFFSSKIAMKLFFRVWIFLLIMYIFIFISSMFTLTSWNTEHGYNNLFWMIIPMSVSSHRWHLLMVFPLKLNQIFLVLCMPSAGALTAMTPSLALHLVHAPAMPSLRAICFRPHGGWCMLCPECLRLVLIFPKVAHRRLHIT